MAPAIKELMTGLIDYAGLFPPAGLAMDEAVRRYAGYRAGGHRPALGRFVVPTRRLERLQEAFERLSGGSSASDWPVSVIVGSDTEAEIAAVAGCIHQPTEAAADGRLRIESLEHAIARPGQITRRLSLIREHLAPARGIDVFFEVSSARDPRPFLAAIAELGDVSGANSIDGAPTRVFAKIRTGGVTAGAFPTPESILRFVISCHEAEVAFKATAGLHHPLSGCYALTYEPRSDLGMMTGFLNLFLTATAIHAGIGGEQEWTGLLTETLADAFSIEPASIRWRDLTLPADAIADARRGFALSFGSCSFEEPINELRELAESCTEA